ncbi:hypothetical protein [Kurthia sp. Dielmo]|uniref:hypothetical protein n=1 Tax=Kurthia sp. Dielmo TaxID=1033738 RepID=UPI0005CB8D35|nr:hypothetical protein [Kurthia sp. Dielmo]
MDVMSSVKVHGRTVLTELPIFQEIDVNVVERLQQVLCECLGICVPQEEIAVESVQLYADEMDERLVPTEMLKGLTEPIQA